MSSPTISKTYLLDLTAPTLGHLLTPLTSKSFIQTEETLCLLSALGTAAEGGTSRLASTWRVYNELAATRPNLIKTLSEDWPLENFGNAAQPYAQKPLLYYQPATSESPERVLLQYARRSFTGFGALPRSKSIPPITEAQADALDAIHFLGERYDVGLDFRQGDILYVNNLAVFHARDGFTDTVEQQ